MINHKPQSNLSDSIGSDLWDLGFSQSFSGSIGMGATLPKLVKNVTNANTAPSQVLPDFVFVNSPLSTHVGHLLSQRSAIFWWSWIIKFFTTTVASARALSSPPLPWVMLPLPSFGRILVLINARRIHVGGKYSFIASASFNYVSYRTVAVYQYHRWL